LIHIVGQGVVKEMDAFNDVKGVLSDGFDVDVYLGAFMAAPLKVELKNKVIYKMESLNKIELLKISISTGQPRRSLCSSITLSAMRKFQPQVLASLTDRKHKM
jgi:hypothetical protein